MITEQDIKRVENKLDAIIKYFNIDADPRNEEIKDEIKQKVIRFQQKRKKVYNKET